MNNINFETKNISQNFTINGHSFKLQYSGGLDGFNVHSNTYIYEKQTNQMIARFEIGGFLYDILNVAISIEDDKYLKLGLAKRYLMPYTIHGLVGLLNFVDTKLKINLAQNYVVCIDTDASYDNINGKLSSFWEHIGIADGRLYTRRRVAKHSGYEKCGLLRDLVKYIGGQQTNPFKPNKNSASSLSTRKTQKSKSTQRSIRKSMSKPKPNTIAKSKSTQRSIRKPKSTQRTIRK